MSVEIVPLLIELGVGVAAGSLRSLFAQKADAVQRAIVTTCDRFPKVEGAGPALRLWTSGEAFLDFGERVYAGERDFDDEIIASFINDGQFYLPGAEELQTLAAEIIAAFISELSAAFYRSDDGIFMLANRNEVLHIDSKRHVDVGLNEVKALIRSTSQASTVDPVGSAEPGTLADPSHITLAANIDLARDLIDVGRVSSARAALEKIKVGAEAIPVDLEFRIVTNLGACALADDDIEGACALLEEAHRLQPGHQRGIAHAAVAAHLMKNPQRAMELALQARESDRQDPRAATVLIEELWAAGESEQLEEVVAAEEWITRHGECGLALARIRLLQSRFEEAVALCRSLVEASPEDYYAHLLLSECLLVDGQTNRSSPVGQADETLVKLREAEAEASRVMELLQPTELKARFRAALVIRAVARALLGATAEAMSDFDQVLSEVPTHPDALFYKGQVLLSGGQPAEARTVFECIRDSERSGNEVLLLLADACLASGDAAAAVDLLRSTVSLDDLGWEEFRRVYLLVIAEAKTDDGDSVGPALDIALERRADDPRLLALAAVRHYSLGDPEAAENSLLSALEYSDESDRREVLGLLGALYYELERYSEAVDCYSEVIGGLASHPSATRFLVCLVNSKRLREALSWARTIRATHREPPRLVVEVEAQIVEAAGDLRAAVLCHEELCSRTEVTQLDRVRLASAQFRCGERDVALATVLGVSVSELCHDPLSILELAQLKLLLGAAGYLDDAYLARRCGLDDPAVHLGYFWLFPSRDTRWEEPETVGPGCAVRLKSDSTEQWWSILDDGEQPRWPHDLSLNQEFAQRLLDRRVGETIVLREGLEDLSYEVTAVQSKFVRAFQETAEEFSTRFPGNLGLSRIRVEDGDLSKIFQGVDERHQHVRQMDRMYREGQLPFLSFSHLLGRPPIEVWRDCTEGGSTRIRFGAGTEEESNKASEMLSVADGVVLDLLALLTVHELGLATHLRSRFARVTVPQHVIDELQKAADNTMLDGTASGYLGKGSDGRYTLAETSEEYWAKWREFVHSVLEFAESLDRVASYRILDDKDIERHIDTLTKAGVGAICAGDEHSAAGLVLVSDDLGLSSVAHSLGTDAVNTQAVLGELLRADVITEDEYSSWIERLVSLNYLFVRVSAEDIVRRLEANGYETTAGTLSMLGTLEGPDCDEDSAVSVAAQVIVTLAETVQPGQMQLILSAVVMALQRGRKISQVLQRFRGEIESRLSLAPVARDQLLLFLDTYIRLQRS